MMKRNVKTWPELESMTDEELKAATLERDSKKRFTERANAAYEIQRKRHHAQACIGSTDFYVNKTSSTNYSMDNVYYGGYTE